MRVGEIYGSGLALSKSLGVFDLLVDAVRNPKIGLDAGSTRVVREQLENRFQASNYISNFRIHPDVASEINWLSDDGVAVQLQTGNSARAYYDLMKLQSLFDSGHVYLGVLYVLHANDAKVVGGNLATFERITREHKLMFANQINLPLLIVGIQS
jgi:hypothetical protein